MASSTGLQLPEQFDFPQLDSGPTWLKRFERYRLASSLNDKSGHVQVFLKHTFIRNGVCERIRHYQSVAQQRLQGGCQSSGWQLCKTAEPHL